jgi:multidrug transporter EmrE-like cation transporter
MSFIYLITAFSFNAIANILLKVQARAGLKFEGFNLVTLKNNWLFLLGLFLFATNVIFYFLALRNIPISVAYPVMMVMSFLIINGYAYFFLSEKITPGQIVGYLFVIIGIIMIFSFAKK